MGCIQLTAAHPRNRVCGYVRVAHAVTCVRALSARSRARRTRARSTARGCPSGYVRTYVVCMVCIQLTAAHPRSHHAHRLRANRGDSNVMSEPSGGEHRTCDPHSAIGRCVSILGVRRPPPHMRHFRTHACTKRLRGASIRVRGRAPAMCVGAVAPLEGTQVCTHTRASARARSLSLSLSLSGAPLEGTLVCMPSQKPSKSEKAPTNPKKRPV